MQGKLRWSVYLRQRVVLQVAHVQVQSSGFYFFHVGNSGFLRFFYKFCHFFAYEVLETFSSSLLFKRFQVLVMSCPPQKGRSRCKNKNAVMVVCVSMHQSIQSTWTIEMCAYFHPTFRICESKTYAPSLNLIFNIYKKHSCAFFASKIIQ